MFEPKIKDEYKQISVSPDLKERIIRSYMTKPVKGSLRVPMKRKLLASALSAMVCILLISYSVWQQDQLTLSVFGEAVSLESMVIENIPQAISETKGRSFSEQELLIEVESRHLAEISVSEGLLAIYDIDTGDSLNQGTSFNAKGHVTILWKLNPQDDSSYIMEISSRNSNYSLIADYDAASGFWMIRKIIK